MKKIIATALVLAAATPALANDQLALSLGVEPGQYTTAELVVLKSRATQSGNGAEAYLENTQFAPSRSIHNAAALAQFTQAAEENRGDN